jgi:DNA repair exonuclease SbcCD ATPase subunit
MLFRTFNTGRKFGPSLRKGANMLKKNNVHKCARNYSQKRKVIDLEKEMLREKRVQMDIRDLRQYMQTFDITQQYGIDQANFYQQVETEIPKLESMLEEMRRNIAKEKAVLKKDIIALDTLDLDWSIVLPFELRGDDLVLSKRSTALAIYETPVTALQPYKIDPSELMIMPEKEVGLIPFEEQESGLMVIPDQETALALLEERENALMLYEPPQTALMKIEKDPEPLSFYERVKVIRGIYKTIKAIMKDESTIFLWDLKKLKNLPKVGKHFETIKTQAAQFKQSYEKYKRASSKQEKKKALTEMQDALLRLIKALTALIGLILLLKKMYQSYQELNEAVEAKNKEIKQTLKTQHKELAGLLGEEQEAEAWIASIEEQMEDYSGFWDFVQQVGVCLGAIKKTDLQQLAEKLDAQKMDLEQLLEDISTLKSKIDTLKEQGDVTLEEALIVNAKAFYSDLTNQIGVTYNSIKQVPNDITELKTVYDNVMKIKKVAVVDSSRELRE